MNKNLENYVISDEEKISQITQYAFKLEEICNELQKQVNKLNNELTKTNQELKTYKLENK